MRVLVSRWNSRQGRASKRIKAYELDDGQVRVEWWDASSDVTHRAVASPDDAAALMQVLIACSDVPAEDWRDVTVRTSAGVVDTNRPGAGAAIPTGSAPPAS